MLLYLTANPGVALFYECYRWRWCRYKTSARGEKDDILKPVTAATSHWGYHGVCVWGSFYYRWRKSSATEQLSSSVCHPCRKVFSVEVPYMVFGCQKHGEKGRLSGWPGLRGTAWPGERFPHNLSVDYYFLYPRVECWPQVVDHRPGVLFPYFTLLMDLGATSWPKR